MSDSFQSFSQSKPIKLKLDLSAYCTAENVGNNIDTDSSMVSS